ncbi:MAG: polyprenyl synthetase family protein [Actinomycetota bacterium]
MSALATVRAAPGLDVYLEQLEDSLAQAVAARPGLVAEIGAEALSSGGKRLRPLLVFLTASRDDDPPLAAGVAIELVHMASLVHDDLIDGAELRRGQASVWSAYGPEAASAGGVYLFARAFAELATTGDARLVGILAEAALALVEGEALERAQRRRPDTTVEEYLERCTLKTAKLFEAACLLGSRRAELGAFGLALGLAFQIVDDCLDCAGQTVETGKIAGTDLREGIPTLPLLLAAQEDAVVRKALAGGSLDGALLRVAASGAIDEAHGVARQYAERARAHLEGLDSRDELDAIADAVVERTA